MDIDAGIVGRLEASAAQASLAHVRSMHRLDPSSGVAGVAFHDGALITTGAGRYVNRAVGITLSELSAADLEEVEAFYFERGLDSSIELSSWAPEGTVVELSRRGYEPAWFRAVFAVPPPEHVAMSASGIRIESVGTHNVDSWLDVLARGYEAESEVDRANCDAFALAGLELDSDYSFLAYLDGRVAGCGSVQDVSRVGWLGPAATVPECRSRGVQSALVRHRLNLARQLDCDLVAASAVPDNASARNLSRLGLEATHSQIVMVKKLAV